MTIRRKYSLPNCTLILEGLSDNAAGSLDARPLMTILVNAECHFAHREQPISGGREFFESLVRAVSRYAQEFLSRVHHPQLHEDTPNLIGLEKVRGKDLHRLTLLRTAEAVPAGTGARGGELASHSVAGQGTPVQIDLTTVQLFDLVEAIDQFLADRSTLPDIGVSLQPVSRRYRKADQPMAKRAAPLSLGSAGLAIAAIAFFLAPVPEVRQPRPVESERNPNKATSPNSDREDRATRKPTASPPSNSDIERARESANEITDPTELGYLQRNTFKKLNQAWEDRGEVEQDLEYRVSVGKDGAIIGYKEADRTPVGTAEQTPLPDLLYKPAGGGVATSEAIAEFRVVFKSNGVLQIAPWHGLTGEPGYGKEITDSDKLRELNQQLREQLLSNWGGVATYPRSLEYRVGVTEDGVIADFEPVNTPAWDYIQETPLERLTKPEAAGIGSEEGAGLVPQKPLAQFTVVFGANGTLEVSPLRGFN